MDVRGSWCLISEMICARSKYRTQSCVFCGTGTVCLLLLVNTVVYSEMRLPGLLVSQYIGRYPFLSEDVTAGFINFRL